jgi:CxxC motif-containing protein (DUF1111 family)
MNLVMHDFEPGWDTYIERQGYLVESDLSFDEVDAADYHCVLIPGGRAPEFLRNDQRVIRLVKAFYDSGCTACHRPKYVTPKSDAMPEQASQLIWPYTDLLLHDMGEGLADDRPEGDASGCEWRTPPLWGIGLTQVVSGHTNLLHDGRARNLLEAILWHGGEAEAAKNRVVAMSPQQRAALIAFLNSL